MAGYEFVSDLIIFDPEAIVELFEGEDGEVAKGMARIAIKCETRAKRKCPVDTGRLRASVTGTIQREDGEIVGYVGSDVEYAIYVELGTEHMAAQPYLRPAINEVLSAGDYS